MNSKRKESVRDDAAKLVSDVWYENNFYLTAMDDKKTLSQLLYKADNQNWFNSSTTKEGTIASYLEEKNALSTWRDKNESKKPKYTSEDLEIISHFVEILPKFNENVRTGQPRWNRRYITACLRSISEESNEKYLKSNDLNDIKGPSYYTVCRKFGSWNNALFMSDLDMFKEVWDEEEIRDSIRRKTYEQGKIPTKEDLDQDKNMPNQTKLESFPKNYSEIVQEEFPHRTELNSSGQIIDLLENEQSW